MSLTREQQELKEAVEELDELEKQVNARTKPQASSTKLIMYKLGESFVFKQGDMKAQRKTYINGAEDLYMSQFDFACVRISLDDEGEYRQLNSLADSESGLVFEETTAFPSSRGIIFFDFFWNYAVASQGESYGTTANNLLWLSRKSLGNKDRAQPLTFRHPLRLKGGDAVTFTIKPACYNALAPAIRDTPNINAYRIVVTPYAFGRRDGRMAENAYDRDFRPAYRGNR